MKKTLIFGFVSLLLSVTLFAQESRKLPALAVENMTGYKVSTATIPNNDGPTIISFWATWCKPCILELNELQDLYQDWQDDTNVKILAISIDDSRSAGKVPAIVNGKSWDFDIYLDKNSDLKRALNISDIPYTLMLDRDGKIVWQHAGYTPGDEEILYEELLKLAGK